MLRRQAVRCLVVFFAASVFAQAAHAGVFDLSFASTDQSTITFNGVAKTITFPSSNTYDFQVTQNVGSPLGLWGHFGNIDGTFTVGTITTGTIPGVGSYETATISNSGDGRFKLSDGALTPQNLSFDLDWKDIFFFNKSGTLNVTGTANLSNPQYAGSDPDLLNLASSYDRTVKLTFNFSNTAGVTTLANLMTSASGIKSTSYSGTLSAVPVPTSALGLASLGLVGAVLAWRRRKVAR